MSRSQVPARPGRRASGRAGGRRGAALLAGSALLAALALPTAARADSAPLNPADPVTPTTVTADALPTVQINGVAWSQVVVGDRVYVAGKFTSARPAGAPAGTGETVRNNLLAYDIRTGALITSFAPSLNAQAMVVTASPDGSRIYVGGDFTTANGQSRPRVAAYDTASGALVTAWHPSVNSQVRAIAVTNSTVFLGGSFSAVGTAGRTRLAAVSSATGALLPWAPRPGVGSTAGNRLPLFDKSGAVIPHSVDRVKNAQTSNDVLAMVVTGGGSQVVVAGRFDSLNGQKATGVGALDPTTGATRPFAINKLLTNQGVNTAVYSLSTDGSTVYGSGYEFYGSGNLEGAFAVSAAGGAIRWVSDCRGDTYSSFAANGALYLSSHSHDCANIGGFPQQTPSAWKFATALSLVPTGHNTVMAELRANTLLAGTPSPSLLDWFPTLTQGTFTGQFQAGWSVSGNSQYVVYGGEFPRVNGSPQQGLVRFAVPGIAPNKVGPVGGLTTTALATAPGTVRVSWQESTDQDNQYLRYQVLRDDGTTPVFETRAPSSWYDTSMLTFTDSGVSAGTHSYRVQVTDPSGNTRSGTAVSVSVSGGTTPTRSYTAVVRADDAREDWSLGDRRGSTTAMDGSGAYDLTVNSGVTLGQPGVIPGDTDTAASFNGSTNGFAVTRSSVLGPQTFSAEAWFQTTSKAGGRLLGFGNATTGTSKSEDRLVYMNAAGRVMFGVWPGVRRTLTSTAAYNDGRWHHVVASLSKSGTALYLDGKLVASDATSVSAQVLYGYWRIGGDTTWEGAQFFTGKLDEVAIYPTALTASQVANHFTAGSTGKPADVAPSASFTSAVDGMTAKLDGSSSTDSDGRVVSWAWTFGDGSTATGMTASHTYSALGSYPVTLTVTDDKGLTAVRTAWVTANAAPTAAFTAAASGLRGMFDSSGSADRDGTVTSAVWDFGDGAGGTGTTVTHDYAAGGTYPVTLTVTDDGGATSTVRHTLTVDGSVLGSDAFGRTVSLGLGTADVGGAWTASAGPDRQSVDAGTADLTLAAGMNTASYLGGLSATSADVRVGAALSTLPTGGGASLYVTGRRVGVNEEYRARVRILADGRVAVAVTRLAGSASEALIGDEVVVPGLSYDPGMQLEIHLQVSGTGTTMLAATVWAAGTDEPVNPTVSRTDTTASLQSPGAVGLGGYLSASSTSSVVLSLDDLAVAPAID
jgi:PKD repeat protein